jgi:hypothetical protein
MRRNSAPWSGAESGGVILICGHDETAIEAGLGLSGGRF